MWHFSKFSKPTFNEFTKFTIDHSRNTHRNKTPDSSAHKNYVEIGKIGIFFKKI